MDTQDPLELDSLPSDPREMVLRLVGMTASSLKDIDSRVTDTNNPFVKGLKIDPAKVVREAINSVTPIQPQVGLVNAQSPQIPVLQPAQQTGVSAQPTSQQPQVVYDPNQLEFDFFRKIKPEDLELQLKNINISIKRLESKLEDIYSLLVDKKKE